MDIIVWSPSSPMDVGVGLNNVSFQRLHKVLVIAARIKGTLDKLIVMANSLTTFFSIFSTSTSLFPSSMLLSNVCLLTEHETYWEKKST